MRFCVGVAVMAALVIVPGLALSQELTASQKSERAYGEFETARRTCHLAATSKWDRFIAEMAAVEGALGKEQADEYYDRGAVVFERNSQTRGPEAVCAFYVGTGWLTQTSATPMASAPLQIAASSAAHPAQFVGQTRNATSTDDGSSAFTNILLVVLAAYALISGIIMLPFVRPGPLGGIWIRAFRNKQA